MENRLSKILAANGIASRRKCEELIFAGEVTVNDETILKPQHFVHPSRDKIMVRGQPLKLVQQKVYYLLNKPKGFVCSHDRAKHSKLVVDLLPTKHRLFTVGRLDKNTTGLIIVTNDGLLSQNIIHPSSNVEKEYLVKTDQYLDDMHLKRMQSGAVIDRQLVKPVKVTKVRKNTVKVIIKEGKKHEVRKLVEQAGMEVVELCRIRIGNLRLGELEVGQFKQVSAEYLNSIFN